MTLHSFIWLQDKGSKRHVYHSLRVVSSTLIHSAHNVKNRTIRQLDGDIRHFKVKQNPFQRIESEKQICTKQSHVAAKLVFVSVGRHAIPSGMQQRRRREAVSHVAISNK